VAGESSRFGQAEINLGIMPGGGATQRLTRAIGKVRAMEMVLLGEPVSARDALAAGLINRVVPDEMTLVEAIRLAEKIAEKPLLATQKAKQAVLASFDTPLEVGLDFERNSFNQLFGVDDAREGMRAFLERRQPGFSGT
jgi:enoyl-CoA hydratase